MRIRGEQTLVEKWRKQYIASLGVVEGRRVLEARY